MADDDVALRAEAMLDLWSRLATHHVTLGAACACGTGGGVSLRLEDFELDIVDYLEDAGLRSGIAEVVAFFEDLQQAGRPMRVSRPSRSTRPLVQMLEGARDRRLPDAACEWLLPRIERTLETFAREHGPRQGA